MGARDGRVKHPRYLVRFNGAPRNIPRNDAFRSYILWYAIESTTKEAIMANDNNQLFEAIDKLTEAVDGVETALQSVSDAATKTKVTEALAKIQEGLDPLLEMLPQS